MMIKYDTSGKFLRTPPTSLRTESPHTNSNQVFHPKITNANQYSATSKHIINSNTIQTELAFTLAKNATKPNPFEIIPPQTTWKENNWKTEEALARAAVTLETEWIKGSNH
jgi:hypothetical protein